jgi:hypothetical protein
VDTKKPAIKQVFYLIDPFEGLCRIKEHTLTSMVIAM